MHFLCVLGEDLSWYHYGGSGVLASSLHPGQPRELPRWQGWVMINSDGTLWLVDFEKWLVLSGMNESRPSYVVYLIPSKPASQLAFLNTLKAAVNRLVPLAMQTGHVMYLLEYRTIWRERKRKADIMKNYEHVLVFDTMTLTELNAFPLVVRASCYCISFLKHFSFWNGCE